DPLVLHGQRIALHARLFRYRLRAGNLDAAAGRVEEQAVIAAAHAVAFLAALGERREAVAAAVAQGDDLAFASAIEEDRLAEHGARKERVVRHFVIPGDDVPAVANEHGCSLKTVRT